MGDVHVPDTRSRPDTRDAPAILAGSRYRAPSTGLPARAVFHNNGDGSASFRGKTQDGIMKNTMQVFPGPWRRSAWRGWRARWGLRRGVQARGERPGILAVGPRCPRPPSLPRGYLANTASAHRRGSLGRRSLPETPRGRVMPLGRGGSHWHGDGREGGHRGGCGGGHRVGRRLVDVASARSQRPGGDGGLPQGLPRGLESRPTRAPPTRTRGPIPPRRVPVDGGHRRPAGLARPRTPGRFRGRHSPIQRQQQQQQQHGY